MAGIELPRAALAHPAEAGQADAARTAADHERLAAWVSDLSALHEFTGRLSRTAGLDEALAEVVHAGALLAGARRGFAVLEPADGRGPHTSTGLGLTRAELGAIETVPRHSSSYGRLIDRTDDTPAADGGAISHPDLARESGLDPRHHEVALRLGCAASYAVPLDAGPPPGRLGAVVWLYDEPAEPDARRRHLLSLYTRHAAEHLARRLELSRAQAALTGVREGLLPSRLPRVPGVRLAVRHRSGPRGGGDFYDVLPLPEGALGLAIGSVTGSGPGAVAAMGRMRASLRAYAVMEGEDPVAVLSDLELLLRQTASMEGAQRTATALFAYAEPGRPDRRRGLVLAGAGHCPPLLTGQTRTEYVETALSAPLGMLACWEAPSVELTPEPGETLLLYTDGLLHRTGEPTDRAMARLHHAAACAPVPVRRDPEALADHVLRLTLPEDALRADHPEDVVLLAVQLTS